MGTPWKDHDWRNWRHRHFDPAAKKAGQEGVRPYDLRHSFASFLFQEQRNPAEIAEQLGHSLQMLFSTYAHVIEDLRGQKRVSAVTLITKARRDINSRSQNVPTVVKRVTRPRSKEVIIAV